jgi:hypothetical protein
MRPAVVGAGARPLAVLVDTLPEARIDDPKAAVRFSCHVNQKGRVIWLMVHKTTPGLSSFEKEIMSALLRTRFEPALFNGRPVTVAVAGTLVYQREGGVPRVAVCLHHNEEYIAEKRTYIAMQAVVEPQPPPAWDIKSPAAGYPSVQASYCVDVDGTVQDIRVENETPPGSGFAKFQEARLKKTKFIPAFLDNAPVRVCVSTTISVVTAVPTDTILRSPR